MNPKIQSLLATIPTAGTIKQMVEALRQGEVERNAQWNQLHVAVHLWVADQAANHGTPRGKAREKLAATVRKQPNTVSHWETFGAFIVEHTLDARSVDHRAVRLLAFHKNDVTQAQWLKMLSLTRKNGAYNRVHEVYMRSASVVAKTAEARIHRHQKEGRMTIDMLRAEMLAVGTMASMVLKREDLRVVVVDRAGTTLVDVE